MKEFVFNLELVKFPDFGTQWHRTQIEAHFSLEILDKKVSRIFFYGFTYAKILNGMVSRIIVSKVSER